MAQDSAGTEEPPRTIGPTNPPPHDTNGQKGLPRGSPDHRRGLRRVRGGRRFAPNDPPPQKEGIPSGGGSGRRMAWAVPRPGNARTAGGSHWGARPSTEGALRARMAEDPAGRARRESPVAEDPGEGRPGTAPRPEMLGTDRGSHLGTRPSQRRAQRAPEAEDSAERASPLGWVLGGGGNAGRGGIPHREPARPAEGPSGVGGGGPDPTIIRWGRWCPRRRRSWAVVCRSPGTWRRSRNPTRDPTKDRAAPMAWWRRVCGCVVAPGGHKSLVLASSSSRNWKLAKLRSQSSL